MKIESIDYTKARLGSRSKTGLGKVSKCPKCGRKGVLSSETTDRRGIVWPGHVTHKMTPVMTGPFPIMRVDDSCSIPLSEEGAKTRAASLAVRELFEGIRESCKPNRERMLVEYHAALLKLGWKGSKLKRAMHRAEIISTEQLWLSLLNANRMMSMRSKP